jgi:hypothetical protein
MTGSKFSAVDAALGYAYQIRSALVHALIRARDSDEFQVGIETLDDVTFYADGDAAELLQTKHHLTLKSLLTDGAVDLWKTLRVWIEGRASGEIPASAVLYLITTATAAPGTAAAKLRSSSAARDVAGAIQALNVTACTSGNKSNLPGYSAFLGLNFIQRELLLNQIIVIDAAPNISDLDEDLHRQVRWLAPRTNEDAFLERLEGWWFRRVLKQLTKTLPLIESREIDLYMEELGEQFKREALPIDDDVIAMDLDEALQASCSNKLFVQQIHLVTNNAKRIAFAIRDYFRAYEQRARWLRQDIVLGLELDKYEVRLIDEWERAYENLRDELGGAATDEAMRTAGLSLLHWAQVNLFPIRPSVTAEFLSRGSLHMLADEVRVGWHPEFRERLATLLENGGKA